MTRETKIGLLVGLLFIVAFGLVLSGITNPTPPPTAVVNNNSQASAGSLAAPAMPASSRTFHPELGPDGRPTMVTSEPAVPPATPASAGPLAMAPASGGTVVSDLVRPGVTPAAPAASPAPAATGGRAVTGDPVTYDSVRSALSDPEPRSGTGSTGRSSTTTVMIPGAAPAAPTPAMISVTPVSPVAPVAPSATPAGKKYIVKASDTLYAIARQEYGPGHAAAYTKILEQNKAVIPNPNNLKVGTELIIPPLETASTPAATPATPATPVAPAGVPRPTVPANIGDSAVVQVPTARPATLTAVPLPAKDKYVVQKGDTLYQIAKKTGKNADELTKLNKGVNPKSLKIGQELNLGD